VNDFSPGAQPRRSRARDPVLDLIAAAVLDDTTGHRPRIIEPAWQAGAELRAQSLALRSHTAPVRLRGKGLREAFALALAEAVDATRADRAQSVATLMTEAERFAAGCRADGMRPEQMVVAVKAALAESLPAVRGEERERLAADVVRRSIRAYYAT
jgi:hypothetical protein